MSSQRIFFLYPFYFHRIHKQWFIVKLKAIQWFRIRLGNIYIYIYIYIYIFNLSRDFEVLKDPEKFILDPDSITLGQQQRSNEEDFRITETYRPINKHKHCFFLTANGLYIYIYIYIYIQCPPLILAPLINVRKGVCENKSALFILLIFHSKNSQNSNLSLK